MTDEWIDSPEGEEALQRSITRRLKVREMTMPNTKHTPGPTLRVSHEEFGGYEATVYYGDHDIVAGFYRIDDAEQYVADRNALAGIENPAELGRVLRTTYEALGQIADTLSSTRGELEHDLFIDLQLGLVEAEKLCDELRTALDNLGATSDQI